MSIGTHLTRLRRVAWAWKRDMEYLRSPAISHLTLLRANATPTEVMSCYLRLVNAGKLRDVLRQAESQTFQTFRISNGASAGNLPDSLKLLNWGENSTAKGPVICGDITVEAVMAQDKKGFGRVAVDFEHATVPGSDEYNRTQEPRTIAAYGSPVAIPGKGLFLRDIEWLEAGKKSALDYADLSPAVQLNSANEVVFVHSVALTRNGAVHGLSFFSVNGGPNLVRENLHGADRAAYAWRNLKK